MSDFVFYSMASGSSGNSYYIGNGQYGFLIDAGISARAIAKYLKTINVDMTQVRALFITHIHKDHTQSMSVFGNRWNIPVFTTQKVHSMIDRADYIHKKVSKINRRNIEHDERIQLGEFFITSFYVPHDAVDNSGFIIEYKGKKLVLATDVGHTTPQLIQAVKEADYLIVESNHDQEMLKNGHYSDELKKRVASNVGHMNNVDAANLVSSYKKESLRQVFLCHLSEENNTPELAVATMSTALNYEIPVVALKRKEPQLFILS
ncbi:MAG: MBL fold metallo-hydrolase [Paludibacteraceae bacterium]|nr:MBL fold metallo-hydrolase [Paludibacteraceae bacterium]